MINWQSILSSFDDKPTLLEWLKKVQKALNESALTTVTVTQEKAGRVNSITLTFNFQDGTKIVAPAFTVQDGKDGEGITNLTNNNLTNRIHNVTYDTTDGLHIYSEQLSEYTNIDHINRLEFRLPIMAGNGINIAKRENTNEIEIKVDTTLIALKSDLPPRTYRHLLTCSNFNADKQYRIAVYSTKNDDMTTEYVLANKSCLVGAISTVFAQSEGTVTFDRLITLVDDGPPGYFSISSGTASPANELIKIDSDSLGPL